MVGGVCRPDVQKVGSVSRCHIFLLSNALPDPVAGRRRAAYRRQTDLPGVCEWWLNRP